jgi:hypothetical protein
MQQRIKHSKYRNTGILFELLARQITSDLMYSGDSKAVDILKKFFRNTELAKELSLYNLFLKNQPLTESKAEILINTICEQSKKLDQKQLDREKYNLIKEIKKHYNLDDFFKAKIHNYKVAAAVYTLLEANHADGVVDPEQILDNKVTILEFITRVALPQENPTLSQFIQEDKDIKTLSYKFLVERFNQKYSNLSTEQKELLKEYINNISDTVSLKNYLNNKLEEVKQTLTKLLPKVESQVTKIKLTEVLKHIQTIPAKQSIKDDHLVALMQYFELVRELKSI